MAFRTRRRSRRTRRPALKFKKGYAGLRRGRSTVRRRTVKGRRRHTRTSHRTHGRVTNNMRSKLLDFLTVPQTLYTSDSKRVDIVYPEYPPADGYYGKRCVYFANQYSLPRVNDITKMMDDLRTRIKTDPVMDVDDQSVSQKFFITKNMMRVEYSNMSKATVYMTIYYCKVRKNIPSAYSLFDPLIMLSQGFSNRRITQTASTTRGVEGLTHDDLTPFDSPTFTHWVNIYKVKRLKLQGGASGRFSLVRKSVRTIHMDDIVVPTSTTAIDFADFPLMYSHLRGAKFPLVKVTGEVLSFDNAALTPAVTTTTPTVVFNTSYHYEYKQATNQYSRLQYSDSVQTAGFDRIANPTQGTAHVVTEQGQQRVTDVSVQT